MIGGKYMPSVEKKLLFFTTHVMRATSEHTLSLKLTLNLSE